MAPAPAIPGAASHSCMSWATQTWFPERASHTNSRGHQLDFSTSGKRILLLRYITSLDQIQPVVGHRPAPYTRKLSTDHATGFSGLSVCVTRMNLARTGVNVATVVAGEPLPSATGVPQVLPSIET